MGASESVASPTKKGENQEEENQVEVLNASSMDLIEKTADYLKSMESENYGRFKLMQYRVSKRQFAVIERITSEFKEFENFCKEVDKRLKFDAPQLVRWIRAYKSCEKEYCSSFFKIYISLDYLPHTLFDQLESRKKRKTHCGEKEIFIMIDSVLSALIYLNSNGIQHKFIQPKTILYDQVNREYQICDIQFLNGGLSEYHQYLFGAPASSCYLSPQLLRALGHRQQIPEHSPSKSDVFSLGLCALEMATMKSVQSIYDFHEFTVYEDMIDQLLQEVQTIYSDSLSQLLISMLSITEIQRPDFDDLAYILKDLSIKPQFIDSRQSLRASVISEELGRSTNRLNKKNPVLERPASCNLLRSKGTNGNSSQSNLAKQGSKENLYLQKQSTSTNSNTKSQNIIRPATSILKKSAWRHDGVIGEEEEEDYQLTAVNTISGQDSKEQQMPYIRVLEPILTHENDEVHSPMTASNQQLGEISSLNLISQRNFKQLSAYNQEDLEMQKQVPINRQQQQQTINKSQQTTNQNIGQNNPQFQNGNLSHNKQTSIELDQPKQQQQNRQQRSQSQISIATKMPNIDPVEQEYQEFKAKQRTLYMQQKHGIIQNEQDQYQLDKQTWEQQQKQHILDSKKHEELQQSYLQSQFEDTRKYVSSQQSVSNQTREFTNLLQNQNKANSPPKNYGYYSNKSPIRQDARYGQNVNTPNNNRIEAYQNARLPPSSGRNSQMRSIHHINKSPKIQPQGKSHFYNDENEFQYENKYTGRSQLNNNIHDNTMYHDYQTNNNLNNSRFDNSIINSKADMSMLSNYEIKDIHIQPLRKNDVNINSTLNMLEERINKIDQTLSYSKKPLRSSSNSGFAFHQNSKLITNQSGKGGLYSQSRNNYQGQYGSSAKSNSYNNGPYDSNNLSHAPFQQGYNFENSYQSHF